MEGYELQVVVSISSSSFPPFCLPINSNNKHFNLQSLSQTTRTTSPSRLSHSNLSTSTSTPTASTPTNQPTAMAPSLSSVASSASSISSTSSLSFGLASYPYGTAGQGLDFTPSYNYSTSPATSSAPISVRAIYSKDGRGHDLSGSYPYSRQQNASTEKLAATNYSFSRCGYAKDGQGFDFSESYAKRY